MRQQTEIVVARPHLPTQRDGCHNFQACHSLWSVRKVAIGAANWSRCRSCACVAIVSGVSLEKDQTTLLFKRTLRCWPTRRRKQLAKVTPLHGAHPSQKQRQGLNRTSNGETMWPRICGGVETKCHRDVTTGPEQQTTYGLRARAAQQPQYLTFDSHRSTILNPFCCGPTGKVARGITDWSRCRPCAVRL